VRGKPTTTFNGWPKSKEAFDKACGVSGWTLHDLRRTVATGLAALEVSPHIIERLLNHKFGSLQNQTTDGLVTAVAEIYNRHLYIEEMRAAIKVTLGAESCPGTPSARQRKRSISFLRARTRRNAW
jgi:integrase